MNKTKIDWCDSTWNPVTGCLHGCKYCYARGIAHRFGGANDGETDYEGEAIWTFEGEETRENHVLDYPTKWYSDDGRTVRNAPYPFYFDPTFHCYRLNDYIGKKGRNIFVCSMADLFGKWVPDSWIEKVFEACEKAPQHNYLFLTKNPTRYVQLQDSKRLVQKDNMWYGASVTDGKSLKMAADAFGSLRCGMKTFFSIEPILEDIATIKKWEDCTLRRYMDWVIIGAETGKRKDRVVPNKEWIKSILIDCRESWVGIPVFMKSSLTEIWGEPLIQEFPKQLMH